MCYKKMKAILNLGNYSQNKYKLYSDTDFPLKLEHISAFICNKESFHMLRDLKHRNISEHGFQISKHCTMSQTAVKKG